MSDGEVTEWFDKTKIQSELSMDNQRLLGSFEIFDTIDSTNTYLLKIAKLNKRLNRVCLAEEQTEGRGRQGKQWFSPKGTNIYCSLLWYFFSPASELSHLSLAVAVMLIRALRKYGIHDGLQLKWPNDIYFAHRKLAGILIERTTNSIYPVVIGIGINLQLPKKNLFLGKAIAVDEITGQRARRNELAGLIINQLLTDLRLFDKEEFAPFLPEWNQFDFLRGKFVGIRTARTEMFGIAQGVNEQGELFIRNEHGKVESYRCGEVSVRLGDDLVL